MRILLAKRVHGVTTIYPPSLTRAGVMLPTRVSPEEAECTLTPGESYALFTRLMGHENVQVVHEEDDTYSYGEIIVEDLAEPKGLPLWVVLVLFISFIVPVLLRLTPQERPQILHGAVLLVVFLFVAVVRSAFKKAAA